MPRLSSDRSRFHTSNATNAVDDTVNELLSDGVVSASVCGSVSILYLHLTCDFIAHTVVGSILLSADQHLGVVELAVRASADLIDWLHTSERFL